MSTLVARWNHTHTSVEVFEGSLKIANVGEVNTPDGKGWRVYPLTTARKPSRKAHKFPSDALQSYYGKKLRIFDGVPAEVSQNEEVITAVFMVQNAVCIGTMYDTMCVTRYARLRNISRDAVLPYIQQEVALAYRTTINDVEFKFWCNTVSGSGGLPTVYIVRDAKVAVEN